MLPKAKTCIFLRDAHELVLLSILEAIGIREVLLRAEIVEAVGVKCVRVLVVAGIVQDSQIGSINENASWDAGSVFQNQRFLDIAFEGVLSYSQLLLKYMIHS